MIRNKINQILDSLPEEELNRIYGALVSLQAKYEFRKKLDEVGVIITVLETEERSQQVIEQWDNAFAKNISEEIKEAIHYNQYKWHIFSYNKLECLVDDAARAAFDDLTMNELYVFYQNSPFVFLYQNAKGVTAEIFDHEQDIYIFDKSLTWTYVQTHESMCGPYFLQLNEAGGSVVLG